MKDAANEWLVAFAGKIIWMTQLFLFPVHLERDIKRVKGKAEIANFDLTN